MTSKTYEDIRFDAPIDWIDNTVITLVAPRTETNFRPNIVVSRE